jgi:hypothetical protein
VAFSLTVAAAPLTATEPGPANLIPLFPQKQGDLKNGLPPGMTAATFQAGHGTAALRKPDDGQVEIAFEFAGLIPYGAPGRGPGSPADTPAARPRSTGQPPALLKIGLRVLDGRLDLQDAGSHGGLLSDSLGNEMWRDRPGGALIARASIRPRHAA